MAPNNHDSFIRSVFSTPVHAASLLATFMGKRFINDYDLATLALLPCTLVNAWVSPPGPPIGFPITMDFQGVIEESPGFYVKTNMVIDEVK